MGSVLSGVGGVIGSCFGACAGYCACSACRSLANMKASRVPYIIMMFFSLVVATILRYYGGDLTVDLYVYKWEFCKTDACYGIGAVYRITFALFVFFSIMGCLSLSTGCVKSGADSGHWLLKSLLFTALNVGAFFLPNEVYGVVANVFKPIAGIFLVIQVVVLIEFVYSWNEDWLEKDWKKGILLVSLTVYLVALAGCILLFHYYGGGGCTRNQAFIAITLIWTLIFSILSVWVEGGGILPASLMTLYAYWLCYSAVSDMTNKECNPFEPNNTGQIIAGFIVSAASCCYAAWSLSNNPDRVIGGKKQQLIDSDEKEDEEQGSQDEKSYGTSEETAVPMDDVGADGDEQVPASVEKAANEGKKNVKFHIVMVGAVAYAAMLLSNWGGATSKNDHDSDPAFSMWVKVLSEWITCALYTWSLVVPLLLTNRDFS